MKHFKSGIPIVGTLAMLFGATGCADESHWGASSDQKGGISLTLTTGSTIDTSKPVFRSETDETGKDANDLNTYIKVPTPDEFCIKLEKSDESFSKTWTSLQGFINYTDENDFPTGAYTLTAYHGEKGKQDFDAPYFEASATFNVLSDEVYELNLVAELMNSMVKVNYTDEFKEYMSDYHSRIRTEGRAEEIIYTSDQVSPAFIEPNNASLTVHFTTKGKDFTSSVKIGDFAPLAKTLHNITFDVAKNENGNASLEVSFDENLEEENIIIDLTEELLTHVPVISCTGFANGATLDMLEGNVSSDDLKMTVSAPAQIKSAIMTVESSNFRPSWGSQIDLCQATEEQIKDIQDAGIEAIGFGFRNGITSDMAELILTQFGKSLPIGRHTLSLQVTDANEGVSDVASVTFDSQPVAIEVIGTPEMAYGVRTVDVTVNYNGIDPLKELTFKSTNEQGNLGDFKILSCEELTATRTIESKQYILNLELPSNVTATRESLPLKIYHSGSEKASGIIDVIVPAYTLQYDAFTDHAFIKILPVGVSDPDVIRTMIDKIQIKLKLDGSAVNKSVIRDTENGYLEVVSLDPEKEYTVSSCITEGETWNDNVSFTTETELPIPNGEFKGRGEELKSETLQVGGQYSVAVTYTLKSSFSYIQPADWANVNSNTAWSGSSNKNTWFIVPSTWLDTENEQAVMRSVGYNHNGTTPKKSGQATTYYCTNAPSDDQLEKAAGELFLGEYNFNGEVSRTNGIAFASRPTAISFDYKYSLDQVTADKGYAEIKILAADGSELGSQSFELEPSEEMKKMTVNFNYGAFGKKAAKLIVGFKSSYQEVPPIHIPSGSELNEHQTLGNHTLAPNSYHALATGAKLTVDNVKAHYGSGTPAAKPAKKSSFKKR